MFALAFLAIPFLDLTPGTQAPFFFLGTGVVAGILLLQNNMQQLLDPMAWREKEVDIIGAAISLGSIVVFLGLTLNLSMLAFDGIQIISAITVLLVLAWSLALSLSLIHI